MLPSNVAVGRGAEVVLDVARALDLVRLEGAALELVEDRAVRLAHHVGQHVEAAAMGHAEHDLLDAELAAALDDLLERRDHRLAAVEAEALGAGVLHVEELLEALGLDRACSGWPSCPSVVKRMSLSVALDAFLDPGLLRRDGDVHELDADVSAVGAAEDLQRSGGRSQSRGRARGR